jgi:hypothetical protein
MRRLDLEHGGVDSPHQLARSPVGDQRSAVEDRNPVAALRLVHQVGGDEDRGAAVDEPEERLPELAPVLGIDRAGGLVEKEQLRLVHHGGGEAQALLLPSREVPDAVLLALFEAILGEKLVDARSALRRRDRVDLAHELEVLPHREVLVEGEALGHVADLAAQPLGVGGDPTVEHLGLAFGRPQEPAEHPDRGGLSRAVGTEKSVDLGAADLEVHVVDGQERAEGTGQVAGADRDLVTHRRKPRSPSGNRAPPRPESRSGGREPWDRRGRPRRGRRGGCDPAR